MTNKKEVRTRCPDCGEEENLHANVDYSSKEYKVDEYLCNECGRFFKPIIPLTNTTQDGETSSNTSD